MPAPHPTARLREAAAATRRFSATDRDRALCVCGVGTCLSSRTRRPTFGRRACRWRKSTPPTMALSPYRLRDERLQLEALVDSLELAPLGSCQFVRAYSPCSAVDLRSKLAAGDSNVGFSPRWRAPARGMAAPQPRVASMRAYRPRAAPSSSFCRPRRARGPFSRRRSGASRPKEPGMGQRLARGLDRRPCERCGHQQGLHVERDGRIVCVVCDRASQLWPCSTTRLEAEPSATC